MATLDPNLLKAFVAVADTRSFTRAALMLHRTQSAVSMQIRRLEDRLGVTLFHRTTVSVELTSAGEGLLDYARRILKLNTEALGRLQERKLEGSVRLGVMDDYGTVVLPALLASFAQAYPRVHITMETGLTAHMPAQLGQAFDLVIAMHPEGHRDGEFLRREQAVWAAAPDHSFQKVEPLPVALYPSGCLFRKWAMEALDAARRSWRLAFVSHSLAAVEAVAAEALAVTVVKASMLPARLRALSDQDGMPPLPRADIRLHRSLDLSVAGSLLADHLVRGMTQQSS